MTTIADSGTRSSESRTWVGNPPASAPRSSFSSRTETRSMPGSACSRSKDLWLSSYKEGRHRHGQPVRVPGCLPVVLPVD